MNGTLPAIVALVLILTGILVEFVRERHARWRRPLAALPLVLVALLLGWSTASAQSSPTTDSLSVSANDQARLWLVFTAAIWGWLGHRESTPASTSEPGWGLFNLLLGLATLVTLTTQLVPLCLELIALLLVPIAFTWWRGASEPDKQTAFQEFQYRTTCAGLLLLGCAAWGFATGTAVVPTHPVTAPMETTTGPQWVTTVAAVLLLCGVGGGLRCFPFPDVDRSRTQWRLYSRHWTMVLPLIAGVDLLRRLLPPLAATDSNSTVLVSVAIACLFPLIFGSAGWVGEQRLARRFESMMVTTYGLCLAAIVLSCWEVSNLDRRLELSAVIASGHDLVPMLLTTEIVASVAFAAACLALSKEGQSARFLEEGQGLGRSRPLVAATGAIGLLSLSGLPPFPGFWSRLQLVSGLLIAHHRSSLTDLYELHGTTLLVAAVAGAVTIRFAMGSLEILSRWFLEEPLQSRFSPRGIAQPTIGLLAAGILIVGTILPAQLAAWSRRQTDMDGPIASTVAVIGKSDGSGGSLNEHSPHAKAESTIGREGGETEP